MSLRNHLESYGRRCLLASMYRNWSLSANDQLKRGKSGAKLAGLQLISNDGGESRGPINNNKAADGKKIPPMFASPESGFTTWARWILGSFVFLALPFLQEQWTKIRAIEGQAETVVGQIEHVAEVMEKVATTAEKVSAGIADVLPDNSKLKDATLLIEHISKVAAEEAKLTEDIIHKIDAIKRDVDDLAAASAEPVVDDKNAWK